MNDHFFLNMVTIAMNLSSILSLQPIVLPLFFYYFICCSNTSFCKGSRHFLLRESSFLHSQQFLLGFEPPLSSFPEARVYFGPCS